MFAYLYFQGGLDNSHFTLQGTTLKANTVLDYEKKQSYSINLKALSNVSIFTQFVYNIIIIPMSDIVPKVGRIGTKWKWKY